MFMKLPPKLKSEIVIPLTTNKCGAENKINRTFSTKVLQRYKVWE